MPKSAGSSINEVIRGAEGWPQELGGHETVKDYHGYVRWQNWPHDFDRYYKWAFVRNPWDKIVSAYLNSIKAMDPHMEFKPFIELLYTRAESIANLSSITWSQDDFITFDGLPGIIHYMPSLPCLTVDGECVVDFIGKFENLDQDWKRIGRLYPELDKELPHARRSEDRLPYQTYYDHDTEKMVGEMYKQDVDYFDYKF